MPALTIPPFLALDPEDPGRHGVDADPWTMGDGNALGETMDHWDYTTPLDVSRTVRIRPRQIRDACGLPEGARLSAIATWCCASDFPVEEVLARRTFELTGAAEAALDLTGRIPSHRLAGSVRLTTALTVVDRGEDAAPLAARRQGSVIWRDAAAVILEGVLPRMAVSTASFKKLYGEEQASAAWTVRFMPDWANAHPSTGMVVLLNSDRTDVVAAVQAGRQLAQQRVIISALRRDVARAMMREALNDEELVTGGDFPEGTLGRAAIALIRATFAPRSVSEVRTLLRDDEATFDRLLQSRLSFLEVRQ